MAIACFLLFTVPPLPPGPDRKVPCLRRRIALRTDFCAPVPYLAIAAPVQTCELAYAAERYADIPNRAIERLPELNGRGHVAICVRAHTPRMPA